MNSVWNRFYEIDGFVLDMGEGHTLPETQRTFPMYDRFIPYLGKLAVQSPEDAPKWIVDIGANVGDTVAALIRHTTAHILCVEPTNKFFQLCQKNIANFGDEFVSRVQLVKAYIAQNVEDTYISAVRGGTAVKIKTDGAAESPTYTIPQLVEKSGIAPEDIAIVKVDTDGYDAECIMSLGKTLQRISPLLYWENQINDDNQLQKYLSVVDYLFDNGYTDFFVFDNFGNYLALVSAAGLKEINRYLGRMMHQRSARTFFYVDVLACKPENKQACQSAISNYLRKIEKPVYNTSEDYQAIIQDFCLTDTGVSITVQNIGSVDWTYDKQIKMGLFSENTDTGLRRSLPIEQIVKPDGIYTFSFLKDQYIEFEEKGFGVRMLQEGVGYWGEYRQIIGPSVAESSTTLSGEDLLADHLDSASDI